MARYYVRKPLPIDHKKSRQWALAGLGSSGVATFGVQLFDLVNLETHRAHRLELQTGGIGLGPPFSASFGASDYEDFQAPRDVDFFDFNGVRMTVRETNLGLYSWTTVSFWGISVKISGGGLNIPGIGVSQGDAKVLFSDGSPVGTPNLIPPPIILPDKLPPGPDRFSAPEDDPGQRIPGDILFAFDSYRLKPGSATDTVLTKLYYSMHAIADYGFVIQGHTDSVGSDAYNKALSKRRAETVATWLKEHGFARTDLLKTEGVGKAEPIASNATPEGRAQNRRVEVLHLPMKYWKDY